MFNIETYYKANTVEEAIDLLSRNPKTIPLAGGTDVLVRLHQRNPDYSHIVDIHSIAALKKITRDADGTINVGSGATFTQLQEDAIVQDNIPVLATGASTIGGPQVRNVGTVGGNICNGAPSADTAAPLLVLNATVVLRGPDGERRIPLHNFYTGPSKVDRQPDEIMIALSVAPEDYRGWSGSYYKYAMRGAMDIATIGCGAACKVVGGKLADLRLAFTVAGPTPLRCWTTEKAVQGKVIDRVLLEQIKGLVLDDLKPRESWRAGKGLRQQIIQTLAVRVLSQALEGAGVKL